MKTYTVVESTNGNQSWRNQNGQLDRSGGPAVIENGTKSWYKNGKLHREDGAAIERNCGSREYWFNGEKITKEKLESVKLLNAYLPEEFKAMVDMIGITNIKVVDMGNGMYCGVPDFDSPKVKDMLKTFGGMFGGMMR